MKIVKIMLCELWNGVKQPLVDLWRFFRHCHGLKLFQIAWNIQLEKWQIASDSVKIFHAVHGRLLAVLGWEINCLKEKRNFFLMQIMLFYFNFSTLAQILKASDCSIWLQTRIEKPDVSSRESLLCSGDRDTCNFYEPRQELFYWEYFLLSMQLKAMLHIAVLYFSEIWVVKWSPKIKITMKTNTYPFLSLYSIPKEQFSFSWFPQWEPCAKYQSLEAGCGSAELFQLDSLSLK